MWSNSMMSGGKFSAAVGLRTCSSYACEVYNICSPLTKIPSHCLFVHQTSHGDCTGIERGPLGAYRHTGKTGPGSDSGAGYNINKCVFSHAAGPVELPDWDSTSRAPGQGPAYQVQCNCVGTCTRIWNCRCQTTVLNTSVCMTPTRC